MRVCILTPVLDGAWRLDAAIRSVRDQSYENWRLVILDGGSADGSDAIARRHAAEDSRIELHQAPDAGMYDALRRGFDAQAGTCDLMAWLNADDLYTRWAFSEAVRAARTADWLTGFPALWDAEGRLRCVLPRANASRRAIRNGWAHDGFLGSIQQESTFFGASLYRALTQEERDVFASQRLAGDFHLWRCFAKRTRLVTVPTVLAGFRLHARNRSRNQADAYAAEARSLGASAPPAPFSRLIRKVADLAGARDAVRAFGAAAHALDAETRAGDR